MLEHCFNIHPLFDIMLYGLHTMKETINRESDFISKIPELYNTISFEKPRLANADIKTAYGVIGEPDYDKVIAAPRPLSEFEVRKKDEEGDRDIIKADLDALQNVALDSQAWLDKLNRLGPISKYMARKDIEFHEKRVDKYKALLGDHVDHAALVEHNANDGFGNSLRTFLENKSVDDPDSVKSFVEFYKPNDENIQEQPIKESMSELSNIELAKIFDSRRDQVEENQQYVKENIKSWTDDILADMNINPHVADLLNKRIFYLSEIRIDDPLSRDSQPNEYIIKIDGTRSNEEVKSLLKQIVTRRLAEDMEHLQSMPTDTLYKAEGTLRIIKNKELLHSHQPPTDYDRLNEEIASYENYIQNGPMKEDPYFKEHYNLLLETKRIMSNPETDIEKKLALTNSKTIQSFIINMSMFPPNSRESIEKIYIDTIIKQAQSEE